MANKYFYGTNGNWNTVGNWWLNESHTSAAGSLPLSTDDIIILSNITTLRTQTVRSLSSIASINEEGLANTLTVTSSSIFLSSARVFANITADTFYLYNSARIIPGLNGYDYYGAIYGNSILIPSNNRVYLYDFSGLETVYFGGYGYDNGFTSPTNTLSISAYFYNNSYVQSGYIQGSIILNDNSIFIGGPYFELDNVYVYNNSYIRNLGSIYSRVNNLNLYNNSSAINIQCNNNLYVNDNSYASLLYTLNLYYNSTNQDGDLYSINTSNSAFYLNVNSQRAFLNKNKTYNIGGFQVYNSSNKTITGIDCYDSSKVNTIGNNISSINLYNDSFLNATITLTSVNINFYDNSYLSLTKSIPQATLYNNSSSFFSGNLKEQEKRNSIQNLFINTLNLPYLSSQTLNVSSGFNLNYNQIYNAFNNTITALNLFNFGSYTPTINNQISSINFYGKTENKTLNYMLTTVKNINFYNNSVNKTTIYNTNVCFYDNSICYDIVATNDKFNIDIILEPYTSLYTSVSFFDNSINFCNYFNQPLYFYNNSKNLNKEWNYPRDMGVFPNAYFFQNSINSGKINTGVFYDNSKNEYNGYLNLSGIFFDNSRNNGFSIFTSYYHDSYPGSNTKHILNYTLDLSGNKGINNSNILSLPNNKIYPSLSSLSASIEYPFYKPSIDLSGLKFYYDFYNNSKYFSYNYFKLFFPESSLKGTDLNLNDVFDADVCTFIPSSSSLRINNIDYYIYYGTTFNPSVINFRNDQLFDFGYSTYICIFSNTQISTNNAYQQNSYGVVPLIGNRYKQYQNAYYDSNICGIGLHVNGKKSPTRADTDGYSAPTMGVTGGYTEFGNSYSYGCDIRLGEDATFAFNDPLMVVFTQDKTKDKNNQNLYLYKLKYPSLPPLSSTSSDKYDFYWDVYAALSAVNLKLNLIDLGQTIFYAEGTSRIRLAAGYDRPLNYEEINTVFKSLTGKFNI